MSTTGSSDGEGTRGRILRAAWSTIEEGGAETTLSDVASRAGVSRQAVYLHFGDRAGLLLALVEYMDERLGVGELAAHVFAADSGEAMLERAVDLTATLSPRIDSVARVLESAQADDDAMARAWRDRMSNRRSAFHMIASRIDEDGRLAAAWSVDSAADLIAVVTSPATWRELVGPLGWTADEYRDRITRTLRSALLEARR